MAFLEEQAPRLWFIYKRWGWGTEILRRTREAGLGRVERPTGASGASGPLELGWPETTGPCPVSFPLHRYLHMGNTQGRCVFSSKVTFREGSSGGHKATNTIVPAFCLTGHLGRELGCRRDVIDYITIASRIHWVHRWGMENNIKIVITLIMLGEVRWLRT